MPRATATRPEARLVIAGADRSYPPLDLAGLAKEAGVGKRVEIRDYVTEPELDALYARASVFVFLSEYEGFGLTPLEALSAGVPIVVLDTPIAREVYGEAAWYVPRDDRRARRYPGDPDADRGPRQPRAPAGGCAGGAGPLFVGRGRGATLAGIERAAPR